MNHLNGFVGKIKQLPNHDKWYVWGDGYVLPIGGMNFFPTLAHLTAIVEGSGFNVIDREVWNGR